MNNLELLGRAAAQPQLQLSDLPPEQLLREPIEQLLVWINEYWVPGTIVLVTIIGITQWRSVRQARAERARLDELEAPQP